MKFRLLVLILIFFTQNIIFAQTLEVENLTISPEGIVKFTCIVTPHHSNREEYVLKIYSSVDDFQKPLPLEELNLKVGIQYPVSFDGNKIVGEFDGNIEFDFRLKAKVFPVQITSLDKKFKKGKEITIYWEDFHKSGWYDVEIYYQNELFQRVVGNHRGTKYTTKLPKEMEKGAYEIRVTPSNQKELVSEDYSVQVKSGKTGIVIGAGGALIGVGVLLIGNGSDNSLPVPPNLPAN